MPEEWLTIEQARGELNMAHATFFDLVRPQIPVLKLGKTVRIRRRDLDEFIQTHMIVGGVQGAANR